MDDCFINTTSKGLLFLSSKEINLNFLEESELFRMIKKYSFQNENSLEILISQFKYIKEIDDFIIQYINSIYEILLKCQENIEYEKEEKIFTFLLQLDEEIILDKCLLLNFEKYLNEKNKHPLCYKLIKKIPERKRFPLMNEKLKYYEERSVINDVSSLEDNNLKNKLKLLQTITKNELNKIEEHLNDKYLLIN